MLGETSPKMKPSSGEGTYVGDKQDVRRVRMSAIPAATKVVMLFGFDISLFSFFFFLKQVLLVS